jgi:hypothetical protein
MTSLLHGKSVTQMREVNTGDGLSGNEQDMLFGLGDTNVVSSVSVEWPSGARSISPVAVLQNTQDIWEPQSVVLRVAGLSMTGSSQVEKVTVEFVGGDPTEYHVSGDLSQGTKRAGASYVIETSDDLVNWTVHPDATALAGTAEPVLVPLTVPNGGNHQWFVRVRDAGLAIRFHRGS